MSTQQTQRRFQNAVTKSDDWLYQRYQFVGNRGLSNINCQRCDHVQCDAVATFWERNTNVVTTL